MSTDLALIAMKRGKGQLGLNIEDQRQQRAGLFLRDVAYTIHACFKLTVSAGPEDTIIKFEQMFLRRAEKGQCFHRPYLGCREFAASFAPVTEDSTLPEPIPNTVDLQWMLNDLKYNGVAPVPQFFRCKVENGSYKIPPMESQEHRT